MNAGDTETDCTCICVRVSLSLSLSICVSVGENSQLLVYGGLSVNLTTTADCAQLNADGRQKFWKITCPSTFVL